MKVPKVQPAVYAVLKEMGEATITQVLEKLAPHGYKRSQIESCMWSGASLGKLGSSGTQRAGSRNIPARYWLTESTREAPAAIEDVEIGDEQSIDELFAPNRPRIGPLYPSVWAWGSREPIKRAEAA